MLCNVWWRSPRRGTETTAERAERRAISQEQVRSTKSGNRVARATMFLGIPATLVALFALWPDRPPAPQITLASASVYSPDAGQDAVEPGGLDVTLRNSGDQRAVLVAADITIEAFGALDGCIAEGATPVSETYGFQLPYNPTPGTVVTADLHQDIAPDDVTRFRLALRVPEKHLGAPLGLAPSSTGRGSLCGKMLLEAPLLTWASLSWRA